MRIWFWLFLLPCLLNAENTWQANLTAPFKLAIKLSSEQVALGDSLEVEVEFHYPSSYRVDMDALVNQLIGSANPLAPQWTLLQSEISSLPAKEDVQAQCLKVKIAPLMTGQQKISFLTIPFISKEATQSSLPVFTPIFSLNVLPSSLNSTLPSAPLIPLEPQFPLELTQANRELFIDNPKEIEKVKETLQHDLEAHSFPWLTLVLLFACGGIGWTAYLTRDRWPKCSIKPPPALSPKQHIAEALQTLQKRQIDQEHIQIYYTELSAILLEALQIRLGWNNARKLTTVELTKVMKTQSSLSQDEIEKVLNLLKEIDQVKFAGKKPSGDEAAQFSQQVQEFAQKLCRHHVA